jgi:hypothetical protein
MPHFQVKFTLHFAAKSNDWILFTLAMCFSFHCISCRPTDPDIVAGKGKVAGCFNWAPRHEGILGEWRYSSTYSLTSALHRGEWSVSRPGRFTPRERAPGTHWIGDKMGPRDVLDAVVKRKISNPRRESNPLKPDHPARIPALYRLSCHGSFRI